MENHPIAATHPSDEVFEEYVFDRLSEERTARFEEHLLICSRCQETLQRTDEYVALMKEAVSSRNAAPQRVAFWTLLTARLPVAAFAATAVLVLLAGAMATSRFFPGSHESVPVQLVALRGGADQDVARVRSGAELGLTLDCTGLTEAAPVRIEIVDASGRHVWSGMTGTPKQNSVTTHVSHKLKSGVYWVRLYSSKGDLLREFGLRAV